MFSGSTILKVIECMPKLSYNSKIEEWVGVETAQVLLRDATSSGSNQRKPLL